MAWCHRATVAQSSLVLGLGPLAPPTKITFQSRVYPCRFSKASTVTRCARCHRDSAEHGHTSTPVRALTAYILIRPSFVVGGSGFCGGQIKELKKLEDVVKAKDAKLEAQEAQIMSMRVQIYDLTKNSEKLAKKVQKKAIKSKKLQVTVIYFPKPSSFIPSNRSLPPPPPLWVKSPQHY